ncbi:DMT family transporter [Thiobacillus sedimenti]|uniref:DMT family transporter n=1 Tax=Thiobacillus sedimenti TaxID=3110231 RepID=A0ABZ1CGK4_9PROT|nr:DMT family transporter [Thiobacillus sp. SCUT-2]WRS38514.1 DMT family transporter [Thiobacillus sp. SCUT-2]
MANQAQQTGLFNQDALVGILFALLAAVGFSAKAILVKLAYLDRVDAATLLALRMAFSVPFFIGVALWARRQHAEPLGTRDRMLVLVLGLIGYYLSSFLDFLGLQYVSAGLERLILFLYPTLTVILSALLTRRAIARPVIAAMAVCYAGIALAFVHDAGAMPHGAVLGASLVFASTVSYSVYLVGAGHAIARIGAARFTAYAMIVATAASLLQFAATHPLGALDVPGRVYGLALAMAVFSTLLPVFLLSHAIRRIGSGSTSLIGSVGPIATLVMAYAFLHERLSSVQIAGSALVLAGVLIVSAHSRRAPA